MFEAISDIWHIAMLKYTLNLKIGFNVIIDIRLYHIPENAFVGSWFFHLTNLSGFGRK
jgi:hypothetical protein